MTFLTMCFRNYYKSRIDVSKNEKSILNIFKSAKSRNSSGQFN
ncbi:10361_t:CDS:1, partial [Dentiscutata heterogama]